MNYIKLLILTLLLGCGNPPPTQPEEIEVAQALGASDCGASPYALSEVHFNETDTLVFKVRFVIFKEEDEPERFHSSVISRAIDRLNYDYKEARIQFKESITEIIEDEDAYNNMRAYVNHASRYSKSKYLNIFVYPDFIEPTFAGAAVGIPSTSFAIKKHYLDKTTVSHEMAHCFSIYHTHTIDRSKGQGSYYSGDFICDTKKADNYNKMNYGYLGMVNNNCEYVGPENGLTPDENKLLISNIASYSLIGCRTTFTQDQIDRMKFTIENSKDHRDALLLAK